MYICIYANILGDLNSWILVYLLFQSQCQKNS